MAAVETISVTMTSEMMRSIRESVASGNIYRPTTPFVQQSVRGSSSARVAQIARALSGAASAPRWMIRGRACRRTRQKQTFGGSWNLARLVRHAALGGQLAAAGR